MYVGKSGLRKVKLCTFVFSSATQDGLAVGVTG